VVISLTLGNPLLLEGCYDSDRDEYSGVRFTMAAVLLKTGEFQEIPDNQLISFFEENRDLIQDRQSTRKRAIKRLIQSNMTSFESFKL
jgi:hypothetical protein